MQLSFLELIIRAEANRQYALGNALEYAHHGQHDASTYQMFLAEEHKDQIESWMKQMPDDEREWYLKFCKK